MIDPVPIATAPKAARWWGVVRVVLILLWVVTAAAAWWTAPRKQAYDRLHTDLAAGQVVSYQWGTSWKDENARWFDNPVLRSSGTLGPLFAWRTPAGQVRWIDANESDGEAEVPGTVVASTGYSGPGAVDVARQLQSAGRDSEGSGIDPLPPAVTWLAPLFGLLLLGVVVFGPAPVLGTRWFWFWLGLGGPFGLGIVFWLIRERPWASPAGPPDPQRRDRGWRGFVIGALASLLVTVLLVVLHQVLGDRWIPMPDG